MGFLRELYRQFAQALLPLSIALLIVAFLQINDNIKTVKKEQKLEEPKSKTEDRIDKRKQLIQDLESIIK